MCFICVHCYFVWVLYVLIVIWLLLDGFHKHWLALLWFCSLIGLICMCFLALFESTSLFGRQQGCGPREGKEPLHLHWYLGLSTWCDIGSVAVKVWLIRGFIGKISWFVFSPTPGTNNRGEVIMTRVLSSPVSSKCGICGMLKVWHVSRTNIAHISGG